MADRELPTYGALLNENATLRARVAELESQAQRREAVKPPAPPAKPRWRPRQLDPNADSPFDRPAYGRR